MPPAFTVPFGIDPDGKVVAIDDADADVAYRCPACNTRLILKVGVVRRHHFAHKPDARCSPETALHEATKLRVAAAVLAWRAGSGSRPVVRRRCPMCRKLVDRPITERAASARVEHRLQSGRVLDVAVLDSAGCVLLGIEILVTHAVDADKGVSLGDLTWIELRASHDLDPAVWTAERAGGRLPPDACAECRELPARRRTQTAALAAKYGLDAPPEAYFAIETECWRCHRPTVVFYWPGIGVRRPAPEPMPRTVRMRYSNTVRDTYLANGCARCDALQGEFYLEGSLYDAIGQDPDGLDLLNQFFSPGTDTEWRRSDRGLTIREAIDIVVPPYRPPVL